MDSKVELDFISKFNSKYFNILITNKLNKQESSKLEPIVEIPDTSNWLKLYH